MTQELIERLEPCPFCGHSTNVVSDGNYGLHFRVICGKAACRAAGPLERCAADAIAAWNTRDQSQSARIAGLEGEKRAVEYQKCELQMLLVRYGDHEAIKKAGKIWPEAQKAFEGRCLKCGGTHLGMPGGCDGPPTPSRPHPHARDMIA